MPRKNGNANRKSNNSKAFVEQSLSQKPYADKSQKTEGAIKFTLHDLKGKLSGKTTNQKKAISDFAEGKHLLQIGSAGTGKTYVALGLAIECILEPNSLQNRIVIFRSSVSTRDMGFLPGTEEEKMSAFEAPYEAICDELFKYQWRNYERLKDKGLVEFHSTSHNRGTTFHDSIIIVDEVQNLNYHEIYTLLTRVGENTRIILCGDIKQSDLINKKNDVTGLPRFIQVINKMKDSFGVIIYTKEDIVRSKFVKDFIIADEDTL